MSEQGEQGDPGAKGDPGDRGPQGRRGRSSTFNRQRLLIIFITLVLGLAFFVHQVSLENWKRCDRSRINTTKINSTNQAFQDFLHQFEAKSPQPKELRRFIKIYADAKLVVPVCGPRPLF